MKHFLWVLMLIVFAAKADNGLKWYQGVVVLADKEVIAGEVVVQQKYNIVLFRGQSGVTVYPASKIESVHYFDITDNINRKFIVGSKREKSLEVSYLFELVLQGDILVVREPLGGVSSADEALDYTYYVVNDGERIPLVDFRERVYPGMMERMSTYLLPFIQDENLNPNRAADAIRLVRHYNRVMRSLSPPVAQL